MLAFLHYHRRLIYALILSLISLPLSATLDLPFRIAIVWDAFAAAYILLTYFMLGRCRGGQLRTQARAMDVSGVVLLTLMVISAFLSLYQALALLQIGKNTQGLEHHSTIVLALTTVIVSWLFIQTLFAVHYTHHYYSHDRKKPDSGGLQFPDGVSGELPDFWDFFYFSMVIGMTFQVSDVQITKRPMRHLALFHSALSYFFSTFILALSVNIAASIFQ